MSKPPSRLEGSSGDFVLEMDANKSGGLGDEQLTTLAQSIGAAASARVPLDVTLAALAEEQEDPRLARVARRLSEQLQAGATIEQALASLGAQLPSEIGGLLRAGVECGDLAGTVEQFAQQRIASQRTRTRIRTAIAYPLLILAILVPLALFLSLFVIPMFGELYEEFDLELPAITRGLLLVSNDLPVIIGVLIALVFGLPLLLRLLGGKWLLHRVRGVTPFIGRMWTWSGQREFAALLGSFLNLKLPLSSALDHTGEVLSDRGLATACRGVKERVLRGEPLSQSLAQSIHFDRSLVALVTWGEEHGLLPDSLRIAASVYDDRIDQHASLVRRLLPAVTMVVVASTVLFIVMSLMIPLVKLIEGLSG